MATKFKPKPKVVVTSVCLTPAMKADVEGRINALGHVVHNWSHYFVRLAEIDLRLGTLQPVKTQT